MPPYRNRKDYNTILSNVKSFPLEFSAFSAILMKKEVVFKDEWMHFSDNPLWPWCFGNAAVESKGEPPIRRVVKGNGHLGKIDPIHGLLDALYCFDLSEGKVSE